MTVTHSFRICPTNPLLIEWRRKQEGARWCFFKVCDSKPDAKRIYAKLEHGEQPDLTEQLELEMTSEEP